MKNKKMITKAYVTHFDEAIFTQILASGRTVKVTYYRNDDKWIPVYETDNCLRRPERISHKELAARATDCLNAEGCTVSFRSSHGEL